METTIGNRFHLESTRMDIHDIVGKLNENVGSTVVQAMAGVKDRTSHFTVKVGQARWTGAPA